MIHYDVEVYHGGRDQHRLDIGAQRAEHIGAKLHELTIVAGAHDFAVIYRTDPPSPRRREVVGVAVRHAAGGWTIKGAL